MNDKQNSKNRAYKILCTEFYDLDKPFAHGEEVKFYKEILRNKSVLEAMCGSGRLLISLLRAGIKVDGLDYSSEMLARCREKLKNEDLTSTLYEQDIANLNLPQKYDALIIAIGSFQLFHPREHALEILTKLKEVLNSGGQIFLETFVPWEVLYENKEHEENEKTIIIDPHTTLHHRSINQADKFYQFYKYKGFYKKSQKGVPLQTEEEEFYVNWYYRYEMVYFLEKAGFQNVKLYDVNFSQNPQGIVYIGEKV
jgi:SAM-dependent methyltransferase